MRVSDIAPGAAGLHLPIFWRARTRRRSAAGRCSSSSQPATGERLWRLNASGTAMELVDVLNAQTLTCSSASAPTACRSSSRSVGAVASQGPAISPVLRATGEPPSRRSISTAPTVHSRDRRRSSPRSRGAKARAAPGRSPALRQGDRSLPATTRSCVAIDAAIGHDRSAARLRRRAVEPAALSRPRRPSGLRDGLRAATAPMAPPPAQRCSRSKLGELWRRIDLFLGEIVDADSALWMTDAHEPTGARVLLRGRRRRSLCRARARPAGTDPGLRSLRMPRTAASSGLRTARPRAPRLLVDPIPGSPGSLFPRRFDRSLLGVQGAATGRSGDLRCLRRLELRPPARSSG